LTVIGRKNERVLITVTFTVKKIVTVTAKIFCHRHDHRKRIIFLYFLKENSSKIQKKFACGAPVIIEGVRERCQKI
tara:strand:+ start:242 stop:469 length:228 start_codon:yes stop_codon:yes gene_type:complete